MRFAALFVALLCVAVCSVYAENAQQSKRGLVVLDDYVIKTSHSLYFAAIEESGFKLDYKTADDSSLALSEYGEPLYDLLILFAPSANDFGGTLSVDAVLNFIDTGHNVVLVGGSKLGDPIKEIASECGIEFDDDGTAVIDHFHYDVSDSDGEHTLIVVNAEPEIEDTIILDGAVGAPILYRGIGHRVAADTELVIPLLRASDVAFSHSPRRVVKQAPHSFGKDTALVSVLQARNNARVTVSGSLELFSDKFFTSAVQRVSEPGTRSAQSGNQRFAVKLTEWTAKERGVLRAQNVKHHKVGESQAPAVYRIKDDISFSVDIHELKNNAWVPYTANNVQLEFVMLDPYIRANLQHDGKGNFRKDFKAPDVYGVFSFRIAHFRTGYTSLSEIVTVPVRPYRHDEYERFIVSAYPYYAGTFSMFASLFLFSLYILWNRSKIPFEKKND